MVDNIKITLHETRYEATDWIQLVQYRAGRLVLVNTIMSLRVP
jgi:hypothetical protein